ncbi:MAG: protein kinase [Anaerolineae bacterium]|nr:protein kinase [Anaerolineae bacterium]
MKQRIGDRYEFDRTTDIIGRGGMGTVYKGIDIQTGQMVAIKQLKPDIIEENPDFVERFNREAEALRRLNHPNIVDVLDTLADDDAHYLIMEYVSGGSLWDEMQKTKQLPIARVLQIALDLSDALTRAHRLKIVHRDLKPANILIADDGTPRLTDFGVAQLSDKSRVTRTGAVVGTLNYLSPEALNGDPIDERTDIWAFGVMLYEMLAGHNPFPEESATAMVTAILTKPIADLNASRPDVPAPMTRLIEQMLIKDRAKRIDSIRKVGSELEDIIRYADSDAELAIAINPDLLGQHTGRFDTPTPSSNPQNTLSSNLKPVTPSKPMVTLMKSDTGEEYVVMPRRFANKLQLLFVIVPMLAIVGILIFIATRPRPQEGDTNITVIRPEREFPPIQGDNIVVINEGMFAPIAEDDYPVAVLSGFNPEEQDIDLQMDIIESLRQILEVDIPYSNIRIVNDTFMMQVIESDANATALPQAVIEAASTTQAPVLLVLPEETEDGLHISIQLGELTRFPYNNFERSLLERMVNVELSVSSASDIAPYIAGALAIIHSADGNLFEFMRMMTILSQLPEGDEDILSAGTSASVYGYFINFLNDSQQAYQDIGTALERDGGNALLFMYRSLLGLRDLDFESAGSDLTSARRIGPINWTFPAYAVATFSVQDRLAVIEAILTVRPDDWFAYSMLADQYYSENNLEGAREALDNALARDPQLNMVHLLSFMVAVRQGRLSDAGALLNDLVTLFPDPNFSYRLMQATFGETYAVSILLYSALANLIIGQYNRVIDDTDTILSFIENPEEFIRDTTQLSITPTPNPDANTMPIEIITEGVPFYYASDLFMMRGMAYCSVMNYEEALNMYNIALGIDPTNHMLRLLRAEIHFLNDDQQAMQADIAQAMGLSDELDALITDMIGDEADIAETGCSLFFDVLSQMALENE